MEDLLTCEKCGWRMEKSSTSGKLIHDTGTPDCPNQTCEMCGKHYEILSFRGRDAHRAYCESLLIFDRTITPPKKFVPFIEDGLGYFPTFYADEQNAPEPIVICSNKTFIRQESFAAKGWKFAGFPEWGKTNALFGWKPHEIKTWLVSDSGESTKDLFLACRNYFQHYVFISDSRAYDVHACLQLAYHVWPAFDAFPREFVSAIINSGKSQLIRAKRNLAPLPVVSGDATKASLYRLDLALWRGIDNCDDLPDEQFKDLDHYSQISYQSDMPALRADERVRGKGRFANELGASGPLVIGTTRLVKFSDAAKSRAFVHNLLQAPSDVEIPELPADVPDAESDSLRPRLYAWGLENLSVVRQRAAGVNVRQFGFSSRDAQLIRPLLAIALLIGDEGVLSCVVSWTKENFGTHHAPEEFGEQMEMTQALYALYGKEEAAEIRVVIRDVAETWLSALGIGRIFQDGRPNDRFAGAVISKAKAASAFLKGALPGTRPRMAGGQTIYHVRRSSLNRLFSRYGLLPEVDKQTNLTSTTPTIPTTLTTSTTSTKDTDSTNRDAPKSVGIGEVGGVVGWGEGKREVI